MSHDVSSPRRTHDGGFSLVEVIMAMLILTFGVIGLAGTTAYAVRQVTLADLTSERTAALESVIERLRAQEFAALAAGADTIGSYRVNWTITQNAPTWYTVTVVTVGPGLKASAGGPPALAPSVADTVSFIRLN